MRLFDFLLAAGSGAASVYLLDSGGRRRRAMARQKLIHGEHVAVRAAGKIARDGANRSLGLFWSVVSLLRRDHADDGVIEQRVRATLGRYVSHPGAIDVDVNDGKVRLSGPILTGEVGRAMAAVSMVRGVQEIENSLEAHETPGNIPALQGESRRQEPRFELAQDQWAPTARFLVGSAGAAAVIAGYGKRAGVGIPLAVAGVALLIRAFTNERFSEIFEPAALNEKFSALADKG